MTDSMYLCLVQGDERDPRIRAWTTDPKRAEQLRAEGLNMVKYRAARDMTTRDELGRLTEAQRRERRILSVLAEAGEDFGYFSFKVLSLQTQIDRRQVRLDVRRMARKGWTQLGTGLWTDEGEPMGSGYAITDLGRSALAQSEEK